MHCCCRLGENLHVVACKLQQRREQRREEFGEERSKDFTVLVGFGKDLIPWEILRRSPSVVDLQRVDKTADAQPQTSDI